MRRYMERDAKPNLRTIVLVVILMGGTALVLASAFLPVARSWTDVGTMAFLASIPLLLLLGVIRLRKRRISACLVSAVLLSTLLFSILAQVATGIAPPDRYYLHDVATSGISPAGEHMNATQGITEATLTFDTVGQTAYWYVDETWPTGSSDFAIPAGNYTFNMYFGAGSQPWWDGNYTFRRPINITAGASSIPLDYPVKLSFNHSQLVTDGKSQADGDDIRIVHWNGTAWNEIDRALGNGSAWDTTSTTILFKTQAAIAASGFDVNHYLYYNHSGAVSPPTNTLSARYYLAESLGETQTSSSAYANKVQLQFTPSDTSEHWVTVASWRQRHVGSAGSTVSLGEARITVNGSPRTGTDLITYEMSGDLWNDNGAFLKITGTTAQQTIGLDFRAVGGTDAIDNARVLAFMIPDAASADIQYGESLTRRNETANPTNVLTVSFTPTSGGDYIWLANGFHHEGPGGTSTSGLYADDETAAEQQHSTETYIELASEGLVPLVHFEERTLTTSSQTFTMRFQPDTTPSSEVQGLTMLLFRSDVFEGVETADDASRTTTTSQSYQTKVSLTTATQSSNRDYIYLVVLGHDDEGTGDSLTLGHKTEIRLAGTQQLESHIRIDRGTYETPMAWGYAETTTGNRALDARFLSDDSTVTAESEFAHILALRYKEPGMSLEAEESQGTVDVTIGVHHTKADGTDVQEIVTSSAVTISEATPEPLIVNVGAGAEQVFKATDPRRLRLLINVTTISGGGSFVLAYNSTANPTHLETPLAGTRPELVNPTLNPTSGTTTTPFNFTIDYRHPDGVPANAVRVNVSDAANGTYNNFTMTRIGNPEADYFVQESWAINGTVTSFANAQSDSDAGASALLVQETPVSATNFYQAEQLTEQSTTSTSWTDIPGTEVVFAPSGTSEIWLIFASGEVSSSTTGEQDYEVRLLINGAESILFSHQHSTGTQPNEAGFLVFDRITGTTAQQTVKLQYQRLVAGTVRADNIRVLAGLLPSGADFQFAEDTTLQQLTGANLDILNVSFTPSGAGDYFIFGEVTHREFPSGSTSASWVEDDAGTDHPLGTNYHGNGRDPWNPMFAAFQRTLDASSKTFTVRGDSSGGGAGASEWRYARLMVYRADVWDASNYSESLTESSTTSASFQTKNSLVVAAPPTTQDFLIIQSATIAGDNDAVSHKAGELRDDGAAVVRTDQVIDRSNNEYAHVVGAAYAKSTSSSHTYTNGWLSPDDGTFNVYIRESTIIALRWAATSSNFIAFDAVSSDNTTSSPLSFSHTIGGGSNRLLVVSIGVEAPSGNTTINDVTYDGVSLTQAVQNLTGSSFEMRTAIFFMLEADLPAAGTYTVTITASLAENINAGAISVEGAAQQAPEATASSDDGEAGDDWIETQITTLTNNAWIFDVVSSGNSVTYTPNSGQTERFDVTGASSGTAGGTKEVVTAGAQTINWTTSGSNRISHSLAAFAPAPAGPQFLVQWNTTGIPSGGDDTLVLRYNLTSADDTFLVWVWDFSASDWFNRGTLDQTTASFFNYSLATDDKSAGEVRIRFEDTSDVGTTDLSVDYQLVNNTRWKAGVTYYYNTTLAVGEYSHFFWANDSNEVSNRTATLAGPSVGAGPTISNFRLENALGVSRVGDQLDVNVGYFFLFNVTDTGGWSDVGDDGNVSLRLWYDGDVATTTQSAPTACEAFGNNWTGCLDALSSNNAYAYANNSPGGGALAFDGASNSSGSGTSLTWSHTTSGTGRLLVVGLSRQPTVTTQTIFSGAVSTTFTVPAGVTSLTVKVWGAGGGGGGADAANGGAGGGGGYAYAVISVTPEETLDIVIGGGGGGGTAPSSGNGGAGGGGGPPVAGGGIGSGVTATMGGGGGGGGYAAVIRSGTLLVIGAGGGGGGGGGNAGGEDGGAGGAGGGSTGDSGGLGQAITVATGGDQSGGGTGGQGGTGGDGQDGGQYFGGNGSSIGAPPDNGGGGGGSGYYGGGGGGGDDDGAGGGGGGSSLGDIPVGGSGTTAGNSSDPDYADSAGQGGAAGAATDGDGGGGNPGRIVLTYEQPITTDNVSYNDVFLTQLVNHTEAGDNAQVELWYLLDPDTGAHDIVVNQSAANDIVAGATSWTGVDQATPFGPTAVANGTTDTATVDVTSASDEFVVDVVAALDSASLTVGPGQSERWNLALGVLDGGGSSEPGASAVTMNWTLSGASGWAIAGASINPAPGGVGDPGKNDTAWKDFAFALGSDPVSTVEVGVEWFRNNTAPSLNVTVSWDGGTSWATNQTATNKSADDNTLEWLDFSSATAWTPTKLNDANLRVRVGTNESGARLDYVTVRVVTTSELTYAEQTTGANYRIELKYVDTADPGNASLGEWNVTEGSATYNASASSQTEIASGPTLIGYEFNLSLTLGFQAKQANDPVNGTAGFYNDLDSWNGELEASDGTDASTLQTASTGEHMEFGVFMYTNVSIGGDWSATGSRGQTVNSNTITVTYRSNDDFNLTIWFTTHLVKGGDTIDISNVQILAAADPNDNITSDIGFAGLGEANLVYILGSASWYFPHATDANENTTVVQFSVSIPLGQAFGTYTGQLVIKIQQKPAT